MSAEKPEPGDVWLHEESGQAVIVRRYVPEQRYGSSGIAEAVFLVQRETEEKGVEFSVGTSALRERAQFLGFNVFDLLAGDPSAWAAALRFAPLEVVTAAFIAQCEAEGKGKELREGPRGQMWALPGHDGPQVLRWLNLSALLEPEAGSEEGKLDA